MHVILLLATITVAFAEKITYSGYKVFEVTPKTERDLEVLQYLEKSDDYDYWSGLHGLNQPSAIMVNPKALENFWEAMDTANIKYKVLVYDVESTIEAERQRQKLAPKVEKGRIGFSEYHQYEHIIAYIQQLGTDYPEKVSVEEFGTSYEGRPLYLVRIGTGPSTNPSVIMDGGIHAREWISPAVALYIIQQLVENDNNVEMIANVNWILIPVLNPDGYEHTHTTDRMWRKTKSVGQSCIGVDANRNLDYHWMGPGTSDNECSETFAGPSPFSEPETLAFSKIALDVDNTFLYLGLHSYGALLLYPWGFTTDLPENAEELQGVGDKVAQAIAAVNGTVYRVGTSPQLTYYVSGTTKDWMMGVAGARLSYTMELPGGGSLGFDLPADKIIPVCEETWPGIVAFYDYIVQNSLNGNSSEINIL